MTECEFDAEGLFTEDYLYFGGDAISPDISDAQAELIWRLLDVRAGADVLDLACGHGRLANRLAARGANVTGLDLTPMFLDLARAEAVARSVAVDYVLGDMRELPWTERFDIVVSWFTSFGYFDDPGNQLVLAQVAKCLRRGGRFVMDLNNLTGILRTYQSELVAEVDGNLMISRHRLEPVSGRNTVERIIMRDGQVRRVRFFVRLFAFPELRDWLLRAGFAEVQAYGDYGSELRPDSRRMIVVARR